MQHQVICAPDLWRTSGGVPAVGRLRRLLAPESISISYTRCSTRSIGVFHIIYAAPDHLQPTL
jgi:hypothetical protein